MNPAKPDTRESVVVIGPSGEELIAILAVPAETRRAAPVGVVIVVGGPQTRVGSHRQFVLLARALAAAGYPCLRFDYTGMGDSTGPMPDFQRAGSDIRRACDALQAACPGVERLALWGLCDGATAALMYASGDDRVACVVAANPWVREEATRAAAIVRSHYRSRLRSREFWRKLFGGRIRVWASLREAFGYLWRARGTRNAPGADTPGLATRLAAVLADPGAAVRLQLSGRDLTAAEFEIAMNAGNVYASSPATALRLADADHTFSESSAWRAVIDDTLVQLERVGQEKKAT